MKKPEQPRWDRPIKSVGSISCTGYEGFFILTLSAWCEWRKDDVEATVEVFVRDGGLQAVKSAVEREVGKAVLARCPGLLERYMRYLAEDPAMHRAVRMACIARSEAMNPAPKATEKDRLDSGTFFMRNFSEDMLADRLGRLVMLHPSFDARWKEIQRERRNQRVVNKVHDL